jgi:UDP-N-acetyl-D-glucosamine dehydrogenase
MVADVLVLGVSYKPDIDDLRESPAIDVIRLLQQKGAKVSYHDPYIPEITHEDWHIASVKEPDGGSENADCVVIITNHKIYDYAAILEGSKLIVDTRNALGKMVGRMPR